MRQEHGCILAFLRPLGSPFIDIICPWSSLFEILSIYKFYLTTDARNDCVLPSPQGFFSTPPDSNPNHQRVLSLEPLYLGRWSSYYWIKVKCFSSVWKQLTLWIPLLNRPTVNHPPQVSTHQQWRIPVFHEWLRPGYYLLKRTRNLLWIHQVAGLLQTHSDSTSWILGIWWSVVRRREQ